MSDLRYDSDGLRDGADRDRKSSAAADGVARKLGGESVTAHPFGDVATAGSFAAALGTAHEHHIQGATSAARDRDDQGQRADKTAQLGDELTTTTTTVANEAVVRSVADGMG
ncbi:DUF2563 family protein [Kutzneria chonburiensis]|jgi:hypothetical protein|uniref:DUF2563 family protein n=1 Tax=Kutzneria chonburiensis TaxID=1483604 RepID=A0ABV6MXG3_9PSEU|nr:DUF2563 family protein [Kutzneria chonburiensis]